MKYIGLMSDTHGVPIPNEVRDFFQPVDEVWHCGDFFTRKHMNECRYIRMFQPYHFVRGNWDNDNPASKMFDQWPYILPEQEFFECEGLNVALMHKGFCFNQGKELCYYGGVKNDLVLNGTGLLVCGHQHRFFYGKDLVESSQRPILLNPGAVGPLYESTASVVRFRVDKGQIRDLERLVWDCSEYEVYWEKEKEFSTVCFYLPGVRSTTKNFDYENRFKWVFEIRELVEYREPNFRIEQVERTDYSMKPCFGVNFSMD